MQIYRWIMSLAFVVVGGCRLLVWCACSAEVFLHLVGSLLHALSTDTKAGVLMIYEQG